MGCGASKASVVNPEKSNPDQPGKKQDNAGKSSEPGSKFELVMKGSKDKAKQTSEEQPPEISVKDDKTPGDNSNLTPVEFMDKLMEVTEVSMRDGEQEGLQKHNSESQKGSSNLREGSASQSKPYVPSLRSRLENDEVVVEEDVTGRTSLLEAKDMKSDATSDLQKTSYGRLSDGATAEGGVTEMKDAEVSEMSAVSSRQDKYAAFNVPLSRDAKSPPAKFSDKSEKLDEKELMEKLNEKQRAAAARKEEELKRKANVTSRVSMKDRLRREIMESRRLEEEAALLEPEETEEDASTTPDEMERDTHFNELTEIGEF